MMRNPYKIELPAVVSFSGGRTSGYMLRHILDAFGGNQPEGLEVCFQNTGLEHQATLDFVQECATRWDVQVRWLEYCVTDDNQHSWQAVSYATAARNGEPFTDLIRKKRYLPNPVTRICTSNLKMRTLDRYLKTLPAFAGGYENAVGLRADEPRRVARIKADNSRKEIVCPLFEAGVDEPAIIAWWQEQSFDLRLPMHNNTAGNCVGCFLKGRHKLDALMREMPEHFAWWVQAETMLDADVAGNGARFRHDRPSYAAMMETAKRQELLPFGIDEDTVPCHCTD